MSKSLKIGISNAPRKSKNIYIGISDKPRKAIGAWIGGADGKPKPFLDTLDVCTFADGTDAQIKAMLDAHYAGQINIADYWSVGDTRVVTLGACSGYGESDTWSSKKCYLKIIDFNHDRLVSSVGGKYYSALTLMTDYDFFDEPWGIMNYSYTNAGGWRDCIRRTYCNGTFKNSLPSFWRGLLKPVTKTCSLGNGYTNTTTVQDSVFLMSKDEYLDYDEIYSWEGQIASYEGSKYSYFNNSANQDFIFATLRSTWSVNNTFVAGNGTRMTTSLPQDEARFYPCFCV